MLFPRSRRPLPPQSLARYLACRVGSVRRGAGVLLAGGWLSRLVTPFGFLRGELAQFGPLLATRDRWVVRLGRRILAAQLAHERGYLRHDLVGGGAQRRRVKRLAVEL